MSTATWKISRETAEIIMPGGRDSIDLDRAWPANWALNSANQYEWCHVYDGGIECVACGLEAVLEGGEEYEWRKVTWETSDGETHEGLEFATYEFSELVYCECGEVLGGWVDQCQFNDDKVDHGLCDNYSNRENPKPDTVLYGYIVEGDIGNEAVWFPDDMPGDDDNSRAICQECFGRLYTLGEYVDKPSSIIGRYDGAMFWIDAKEGQ